VGRLGRGSRRSKDKRGQEDQQGQQEASCQHDTDHDADTFPQVMVERIDIRPGGGSKHEEPPRQDESDQQTQPPEEASPPDARLQLDQLARPDFDHQRGTAAPTVLNRKRVDSWRQEEHPAAPVKDGADVMVLVDDHANVRAYPAVVASSAQGNTS